MLFAHDKHPDATQFRDAVLAWYCVHGRHDMAWRHTDDPYAIMVSEVMLQQTQVARVYAKYVQFLEAFPTVQRLADAELADVLRMWSGLGYNRRAVMLQKAARMIVHGFGGNFPTTPEALQQLPGIGPHTAGSIAAFAFNYPSIFVETNIRTVFLHTFFSGQDSVADGALRPYIEDALDHTQPRRWYYALMDYGTHLKAALPNPNRRSKHYARQSTFVGSDRQIRGAIVRALTQRTMLQYDELQQLVCEDATRFAAIVAKLETEGMIRKTDNAYRVG